MGFPAFPPSGPHPVDDMLGLPLFISVTRWHLRHGEDKSAQAACGRDRQQGSAQGSGDLVPTELSSPNLTTPIQLPVPSVGQRWL